MNPEPTEPSIADKYARCPIPMTHRRLAAAHLLWHQALANYFDPNAFLANLNAAIEALRNVTFVLQNEQTVPDFQNWYGEWRSLLMKDPAAEWLKAARNTVVHRGELESRSSAKVRLVTWRDQVLVSEVVPAQTPSQQILQNLPLLKLANESGAPAEDLKDAVIEIERRWSAQDLDGREILETLAHVYGLLADLVLDAHKMLNQCECIFDEGGHPDFRLLYHRTGTLECMVAGVEQRTQRFALSTLDELRLTVESGASHGLVFESTKRYGIDEAGELAAWRRSDPSAIADNVLYRAKRILRKDKSHQRMMFIRDGHGDWYHTALVAADRVEKYVLMRQVAEFVERRGCDALIEVGECWIESSRQPSASAAPAAREALFVGVYTREGFERTLVTPFGRGPFGGIKMDDTHELDGQSMMHLEPIFKVWRKQGFKVSEDGCVVRRLWEPDPLDVCFCGGPRRFVECCMQGKRQTNTHLDTCYRAGLSPAGLPT